MSSKYLLRKIHVSTDNWCKIKEKKKRANCDLRDLTDGTDIADWVTVQVFPYRFIMYFGWDSCHLLFSIYFLFSRTEKKRKNNFKWMYGSLRLHGTKAKKYLIKNLCQFLPNWLLFNCLQNDWRQNPPSGDSISERKET